MDHRGEVLVVLEPFPAVAQRIHAHPFHRGGADRERDEVVQVVRVGLVALLQAAKGLALLVLFRVERAQHAPALGALRVPVDLGLQGLRRLQVLPLAQELLRRHHRAGRVEVRVPLRGYRAWADPPLAALRGRGRPVSKGVFFTTFGNGRFCRLGPLLLATRPVLLPTPRTLR